MNIAIIGARGYLGRELVRLLLGHPEVDKVIPASTTQSNVDYADTVPAFTGIKGLTVLSTDDPLVRDADAVFLTTAGGEAKGLMHAIDAAAPKLVVDLSRDHRHEALQKTGPWTYGLAEYGTGTAKGATHVANPGCFPTASLLALGPALAAGLVAPGPIIVDGKSGVSGAGATPRADLHYPEMHDSVRAYKVLGHDHEAEIALASASSVRFTPHLVPMSRGLLATVYAPIRPGLTQGDLEAAYMERYAHTPFVSLVQEAETKHVARSNRAHVAVSIHAETNLLVARGAIDNLLKGGAGAAVQNFNLALGFKETLGLPIIGATA